MLRFKWDSIEPDLRMCPIPTGPGLLAPLDLVTSQIQKTAALCDKTQTLNFHKKDVGTSFLLLTFLK